MEVIDNQRLLTIVIPIFNTRLNELERCLLSIPNHPDVYVAIYDDYTTDYCVELEIKKIIENNEDKLGHLWKDGNTFNQLHENSGLGYVRNKAIKLLKDTSEYIMFLDSDDEVRLRDQDIESLKVFKSVVHCFDIKMVDENENVLGIENCKKYLDQTMIPYFITPNIYNTEYLYANGFYFDESRRTFEDIPFSTKVWVDVLTNELPVTHYDSINYIYHLDGNNSLTRNDKLEKMRDALIYWINWLIKYYESNKIINLKSHIFNRIRYEAIKALDLEMKINKDKDKYNYLLNYLKPYNIDKILNID